MRRRWIHFIAVLFFYVGGSWAQAVAVHPSARVLHVKRSADSTVPQAAVPLQMPKFLDVDAIAEGDEYRVTWEPMGNAVPTGAVVTFEYTQQRQPMVQALRIQYPFVVRSRRTATFTIADRAYRVGGAVTSWRVRIQQGGRILAEKMSPEWKGSR